MVPAVAVHVYLGRSGISTSTISMRFCLGSSRRTRGRGVRNDTPAAVPDDEQEASASGAAAGRPEWAKTKSAKVYGREWENEGAQ
jgi:hypothetical protein